MNKCRNHFLIISVVITIVALGVWIATGGDFYTKYETVKQVEKQIDANDPLAAAGFYDSETKIETVRKKEFRFGLLPTPSGLFDKHIISLTTIVTPPWMITIALLWMAKRRSKSGLHTSCQIASVDN